MKDEKLFEGIDKKAFMDSLKDDINREIILKYLFIKSIEARYEDDYIKTKYRIDAQKIRREYSSLDKEKIGEMENELKAKIQAGEIDLNAEAVGWHRESFEEVVRKELKKKEQEESKEKREK